MVLIGVLGPVLLREPDGSPVRLGSARQRRLLAALALHGGAPVPADLLVELIWGDILPADPRGAVHTAVARLRRALPAGVAIDTDSAGYRLRTDPTEVDATRFAAGVAQAETRTDPTARLATLESALALWRGQPYLELDHVSVAPEATRLTQLRLGAVQSRADALLAVGRADSAVAVLRELVAAEPMRETAVALLMRGLCADGRAGEALLEYERLRRGLADQLGLDPSSELRELHQRVLRQEVRPGPAPRRPRLPVSSFVGRDADLDRVDRELRRRRIVTLCGPGGVGKSRLAVHACARIADRYGDGVVGVELAEVRPHELLAAVAAALRLSDTVHAELAERLVEVLAVRGQLLLLDNCEHLADEVARLVEAITVGAPEVDVLATSREALRADGEQVLPVHPLSIEAASELLADRIRAADPEMTVAGELLPVVCRRLDGLPLALELAAARAPSVGLAGLLAELDEPLALGKGRRTAVARHRSLRDVVQWSVNLLDTGERDLFIRMSVFAAAVEPDAVARVCGRADRLPDLIARSLVFRRSGDPTTYGMLETLRAFGRVELATQPGGRQLRDLHADWALGLARQIAEQRRGPAEVAAMRRFDAHLAELRRAHEWLVTAERCDDLLELSVLFADVVYQRGRVDLARLVDQTLAAVVDQRRPGLPRLLGLAAQSSWQRGDLDGCSARCRRAIAVADAIGRPEAAADAHEGLCNVEMFRGDLPAARRHARRAAELGAIAGDQMTVLMAHVDRTLIETYAGHPDAGAEALHTAETVAAALGSPTALGWAAYAAGERLAEVDPASAAPHLDAAVRHATGPDSAFLAGVARHTLLTTAVRAGDQSGALCRFGPLLDHWHGLGAWTQLWIALRAFVETLSRTGRHREVAVLLGARAVSPRATPSLGADSERIAHAEAAARDALGDDFDVAFQEGSALGETGAVALARRLAAYSTPDAVRKLKCLPEGWLQ